MLSDHSPHTHNAIQVLFGTRDRNKSIELREILSFYEIEIDLKKTEKKKVIIKQSQTITLISVSFDLKNNNNKKSNNYQSSNENSLVVGSAIFRLIDHEFPNKMTTTLFVGGISFKVTQG